MIDIQNLSVTIGSVNAVRDVSIKIRKGEIHGLIGESGCGKSVTGAAMLGLLPEHTTVKAGVMTLDGQAIQGAEKQLRGRRIALISQDPAAALNPVLTIARQINDVLKRHKGSELTRGQLRARASELLVDVGLPDPEKVKRSYPHQLSGGMQQRVVIALALATGADFLIADEPTTALDVSIEAQVLTLLTSLVREKGLTILMITHDMPVVARCCDHVSVVYAGMLVENGVTEKTLGHPQHPYTKALLGALPGNAEKGQPLKTLEGSIPPAAADFKRCIFSDRCQYVTGRCRDELPGWVATGEQLSRCHYSAGELQNG